MYTGYIANRKLLKRSQNSFISEQNAAMLSLEILVYCFDPLSFPILNLVGGISLPFNYHNFYRVSVGLPANLIFPKILSPRIWSRYKNLHELALQKGKLGVQVYSVSCHRPAEF